jgi:hypothetical protein
VSRRSIAKQPPLPPQCPASGFAPGQAVVVTDGMSKGVTGRLVASWAEHERGGMTLTFAFVLAAGSCGDPLPPVPPGSTEHYDVGLTRCDVPTWWRGIREVTCTTRQQ